MFSVFQWAIVRHSVLQASNDRMIDELGTILDEAVVAHYMYYPGIFLEGQSKPTKSCQARRCPAKVRTGAPPEYKSRASQLDQPVRCYT
jgi:hypothetical protein